MQKKSATLQKHEVPSGKTREAQNNLLRLFQFKKASIKKKSKIKN